MVSDRPSAPEGALFPPIAPRGSAQVKRAWNQALFSAKQKAVHEAYLQNLITAVEQQLACCCTHVTTALVKVVEDEQSLWMGRVETFFLADHPETNKAYAWNWHHGTDEHHSVVMLSVPPIHSAQEAVRTALASRKMDPGGSLLA